MHIMTVKDAMGMGLLVVNNAKDKVLYIVLFVMVKNISHVKCVMGKVLKDALCVVGLDIVGNVYRAMEQDTTADGNVGDAMEVDMTNVSFAMEAVKMNVIGATVQEEKIVIVV